MKRRIADHLKQKTKKQNEAREEEACAGNKTTRGPDSVTTDDESADYRRKQLS